MRGVQDVAASRSAGISIEKTTLYEVKGSPRDGWLPFEIAMPLQSAEGQGGQLLDPEHLLASSWQQAQRNSVEFLKVPDAWSSENDPAPGGCPAGGEEARTGPTHPPTQCRLHCRAEARLVREQTVQLWQI